MTSTFTPTSTSTSTPTFSSRATSSSTPTFSSSVTLTSTKTASFSSTPTETTTFSSTPTSSYLPIEVYYNKTVSPEPVFQKPNFRTTPGILEIAIIITLISSFIICIVCNIALSKSKRRLREEAAARQELRLREEALAGAIIQQNPLYQV
jgi:hypothetical protein